MVRLDDAEIKVSTLEKMIVNWALLPDAIFYACKSRVTHDNYHSQTFMERIKAMYESRVERYHKLIVIKDKHDGEIPTRVKRRCIQDPCGYTRLLLAYLR